MLLNVVPFVHEILEKTVSKEDITIDATCGNGNDTLLLSNIGKFVYGFDIQNLAIKNTDKLLQEHNKSNYKLIMDSHENIDQYIHNKIKAITFNLGYLPGSDKTILTNESSTIEAINKSCNLLSSGGIICITLYIGHTGGANEAVQVENFAKTLNNRLFKVAKYNFINREKSPYVIIIEKQ